MYFPVENVLSCAVAAVVRDVTAIADALLKNNDLPVALQHFNIDSSAWWLFLFNFSWLLIHM